MKTSEHKWKQVETSEHKWTQVETSEIKWISFGFIWVHSSAFECTKSFGFIWVHLFPFGYTFLNEVLAFLDFDIVYELLDFLLVFFFANEKSIVRVYYDVAI